MKTQTTERRVVHHPIRINRYKSKTFVYVPVGTLLTAEEHGTQPHLVVCQYHRNDQDITITISKDKLKLTTRPAVMEVPCA